MLRGLARSQAKPLARALRFSSATPRDYIYFDNVEVKEGVAILRLNGPAKMNTLSPGMQDEAEKILKEKLVPNKDVKAVVFISSKPDNFIAGADIDMIKSVQDKSKLKELVMRGHALFNDFKKTKLPLVAAINGVALGGGLEWAMYCDYRIASTDKRTSFGLPEVKLGLLPGLGGTYHLPRLIGMKDAMDMILTGNTVRPDKAKKLGLIDLIVDPSALESAAILQAKGLAEGKVKAAKRKMTLMDWALEGNPIGREIMFKKARQMVDKSTHGHYPAPVAILDVLKDNYGKSKEDHLKDEADKFAELAATHASEALIGLYHSSQAVKKHEFGAPKRDIQNIAVLGAGLMGGGIAQVSIDQGKYNVYMKDSSGDRVYQGQKVIVDEFKKKLAKRRMSNSDYCFTTSRLTPLHDGVESWRKHFSRADLVIEAVFEDLNIKHKVLAEIEAVTPDHCIFATNTSAIPIEKIAEGSKRPDRVIGMHYFSPVPKMPLLEIIAHKGTAPEVCAAAMQVGLKQGKTPIFVKDVPGFFVNRCLTPVLREAMALVEEGVNIEKIDKAMRAFGMPVGPIALSDEVGNDVSSHVASFMINAGDLGDRLRGGNPDLMKNLVAKGLLGRKAGKGFYLYPKEAKKGAKQINPEFLAVLKDLNGGKTAEVSPEDIQGRMMTRFVNECAFSLQDGIIRAPADGDIGAVFGIGFSPYLGGPFRYLDIHNSQKIVDNMFRYRDQFGPQFEPAQILRDYAASGKKFHK